MRACPPLTIAETAKLREIKAKAAYQMAGDAAKARQISSARRPSDWPSAQACPRRPQSRQSPASAKACCCPI